MPANPAQPGTRNGADRSKCILAIACEGSNEFEVDKREAARWSKPANDGRRSEVVDRRSARDAPPRLRTATCFPSSPPSTGAMRSSRTLPLRQRGMAMLGYEALPVLRTLPGALAATCRLADDLVDSHARLPMSPPRGAYSSSVGRAGLCRRAAARIW
jgi:hypothetical protein